MQKLMKRPRDQSCASIDHGREGTEYVARVETNQRQMPVGARMIVRMEMEVTFIFCFDGRDLCSSSPDVHTNGKWAGWWNIRTQCVHLFSSLERERERDANALEHILSIGVIDKCWWFARI